MFTLPASRVEQLLGTVAELAELDDPRPFPPQVLARLTELVPSDACAYSELDRVRQRSIFVARWSSAATATSTAPDDAAGYFRFRKQHPVCGYRERTSDWVSARKASDFVTLREFRHREIWNELYRDNGVNYWLDIGLPASSGQTRVFIFTRERQDFDEGDRTILELLQPYLVRRYRAATSAAKATAALATVEDGRAGEAHDVVLISGRGVIEFASPRSRRLLEAHFGKVTGRLPEDLADALSAGNRSLAQSLGHRRLTIRAARTGTLRVLLLAEEDTRLERLTRRQRQILERVALGETDDEIAALLGLSPATVGKHLEHIYTRAGVHTRTAAAALLPRPE